VRLVTADASPLIGLAVAEELQVLRKLYGRVTITRVVKEEITARENLADAPRLEAALREGWLRVAPTPLDTWRYTNLDAGEASTIALALRHENALALMDDARGREQAAALGLEVIGLTDVLLAAKLAGVLGRIKPILKRLKQRGFIVPEASLRAVLLAAGESGSDPLL
jgi:predicted nucleic acid-binding protein